ncbi:MAG: Ldh family oxidoreductase [Isosphaeraceae bacterium]|nr:Ldh family oxidoreductase [Isosphaeraceae bacterium]
MNRVAYQPLQQLVEQIFLRAGCHDDEAARIARRLVRSNLVGHDSHGVIRVPSYIDWMRAGKVVPNQRPEVVFDGGSFAVVDAGFGFGQTAGEFALRLAIAKTEEHGVAVIALRNAGHLGRIGDWPEMAAEAGKVSLHFVSTSGAGLLVAPFGGIDRRLSANPIAAGIPVEGGRPIVLDISTCSIAEGKIRVALNRGERVPDGCIIDGQGRPTNDPEVFYADPGAILPFGGHKGYGLSVITEILAEAFTGNGCSDPKAARLTNGMLTIVLDPGRVPRERPFGSEVDRLITFLKSARTSVPDGEILLPGELEARTEAARVATGIPLEQATRHQLARTAASFDLSADVLEVNFPGAPNAAMS